MSIDVIKPGMYSVFQDLGRHGYQHYGVSVNGVLDERSHRLANILVGNDMQQATLEITLLGPTLGFRSGTTIALCGAALSPTVDGIPVPMGQPVHVREGSVLEFGRRERGVRAYLAVHGGFSLPRVMNSASTNVRAKFGGLNGRPLKKGDVIALRAPAVVDMVAPVIGFPADIDPAPDLPIRIIEGREWEEFTADAQDCLLGEAYTVTPDSDRMGYRLSGTALARRAPREMLSETVTGGTIQVPSDGQPIILMADRGTSGGYPRIANVISVDLPRLAQILPGTPIHFERVTLDNAHSLAIRQSRLFAKLQQIC